jgi:inorganic triphosphatase YgiF
MPSEVELKLEVDPGAAGMLLKEPWLCNGRCATLPQVSTYYDTPDGKVRRHGFTLRVRSVGNRFFQTVKTLGGNVGLFDRGEWEYEVNGAEIDRECLARTPLAQFEDAELAPVIRSKVNRSSCRIDSESSEFQLDYDEGEMTAGRRHLDVSEMELELIRGEAVAAFTLARRIAEEVPVKIGVMSKAERGFALADGRLGKAFKAEPVGVRPGMTIAEAFAAIVSACIRHFRLNEPLVIAERSPEALHQARVALRRLRAAFSLFRSALNDPGSMRLRDELRWFTRQLGDARNLDVFLQRDIEEADRQRLQHERELAYDRVIGALESKRFRLLMLDLVAWSAFGEWRSEATAGRPIEPYANHRIDRLWAKISHARRLTHMGEHQRHRLRIQAKKLRYALEFVAALHTGEQARQKKFAKAVEDLQETLGQLNDLTVARKLVALDSWLIELHEPDEAERALLHDAGRTIGHLRDTGAYWRDGDD